VRKLPVNVERVEARRPQDARLATLGYEVPESMAIAWARDVAWWCVGRGPLTMVSSLQHPKTPHASKCAWWVRSHHHNHGAARDRDQEATWCSEFGELRKLVAKAGSDVQIERAKEVGAEVVKTVPFECILRQLM
jgi:hypothetical protein